MKKSILIRLFAALLVLVTLVSTVPLTSIAASAASKTTKASVSVSSVVVNTSQYYVAEKNTAVKNSTGFLSTTLMKLEKNSIVKISGSTSTHYKVSLNIDGQNRICYIKKADLKKAPATTRATFCYTTSNAVLRRSPFENSQKLDNVSKGTLLRIIGTPIVNKYGHTWYSVLTNSNELAYVYAPRIKQVSKITLTISAILPNNKLVETGSKIKFTYSVSPSAIKNVTFSSSNRSIAPVDISGTMSALSAGKVNITASIANTVSVSICNINTFLNVKPYFQTRDYTCSAASTLAILKYANATRFKNTKDIDIYTGQYVYQIVNNLNKYLGANTYRYNTFSSITSFENAIRTSLAQKSPVIARICFKKQFFNYSSNGHYTTVIGLYSDNNGKTWAICVDSYVNRFASNTYSNAKTGIVHVPLSELYYYTSYNNTSARYLIYNP